MAEKQVDTIDLAAFAFEAPKGGAAKRTKGGPILAVFRFLGSLELAITVLMVLVFVLAAATFVESARGTEFAQTNIYYSQWFIALQVLLAGNMLMAMLLRWPWKVRHTGFLLTHSGLLILLAGAMQNYQWGIEGHLTFKEGETADSIELPDRSQLTLTWGEGADRKKRVLAFDPGPTDWFEDEPLDFGEADGIAVRAIGFYRHANVEMGNTGRPKISRADPDAEESRRLEAAAYFEITRDGKLQRIWLPRTGWPQPMQTGKGPMMVSFGHASYPLEFSLTLVDFTRGVNPGGVTMGDASYASVVRLVDKSTGITLEQEISMNKPLTHGKFTFYQSGFNESPTGVQSTLSVAHDPGSFLKYLGSVWLCLGTFVVFYLQRYLTKWFSSRASSHGADSLATSESV